MVPARAYCTYFDSGYLSRGLALLESLRGHGDNSPVWILALDDAAKLYLDELDEPNVHTLTLSDLETVEPALLAVRETRSRMEYYFTCTPQLTKFVLEKYSDPRTTVIYLDSDLFFFDDPQKVVDAMEDASIGIIEHRYPQHLSRKLAQYGRFNVGWVGFRADDRGRGCLNWWAERCLEWCYDRPDDGRYADQGYLDHFPEFPGVKVLAPLGLNLAPWNTHGRALTLDGNERVVIDGVHQLVFFHFHGVRQVGRWWVTSQLVYGARLSKFLRQNVYEPYLERVESALHDIRLKVGTPRMSLRGNGLRGFVSRIRKLLIDSLTIISGNAIPVRHVTGESPQR